MQMSWRTGDFAKKAGVNIFSGVLQRFCKYMIYYWIFKFIAWFYNDYHCGQNTIRQNYYRPKNEW